MTKNELLALPMRDETNIDRQYNSVLFTNSNNRHDSGYAKITLIGQWTENNTDHYEICGYPDDITLIAEPYEISETEKMAKVRMDCTYVGSIFRYHSGFGKFTISYPISSMDITLIEIKK